MKYLFAVVICCIGFLFVFSKSVSAWGGGHDTLVRTVAERLPEPWKTRLEDPAILRQFIKDNHYPDSFEPIDAERVGPEAMRFLAEMKITKRYDFHGDKNRVVAFCLLVDALREDDPDRVLFWLAVLMHSTADMPACNHDPLVHITTYFWCDKSWEMDIPLKKEGCVDLSWVEKYDWSKRIFEERVDQDLLSDDNPAAEETLLRIMLYGFEGADVCAPHGRTIIEDGNRWAVEKDRDAGRRLAEALSSLGSWAAVRSLRDFEAARRLAKSNEKIRFDERLTEEFNRRVDHLCRNRSLAADSMARNFLSDKTSSGPAIRVLSEPAWRMNEGVFGFVDRVLACQIVGTLRKQGRAASLLDVRELQDDGIDSGSTPLIVVTARRFGSYRFLNRDKIVHRLSEYRQKGGKLLWIAGNPPPPELFPSIRKLLKTAEFENEKRPVGPFSYDELLKQNIVLLADQGTVAAWPFVRPPKGDAGWDWPANAAYIEDVENSDVKPLLKLDGPAGTRWIGSWESGAAYLPIYSLFPYILTDGRPKLTPLVLELDSAGERILSETVSQLLDLERP